MSGQNVMKFRTMIWCRYRDKVTQQLYFVTSAATVGWCTAVATAAVTIIQYVLVS